MALRDKPKKLAGDALWEFALKTLDRRSFSKAELRRKLSVRAESPGALSEVMKKLQDYGLLDDARFAASFAASRLESKSQGAGRVLRDLRSRSVETAAANAAIKQVYGDVDEHELASRYLQRKFRSKDLSTFLMDEKNLAAAYRRLRTGGFSSRVSVEVLKQFSRRAEELDAMEPPESESG
jgi:regulatory protein